jgi:hypothetical protein
LVWKDEALHSRSHPEGEKHPVCRQGAAVCKHDLGAVGRGLGAAAHDAGLDLDALLLQRAVQGLGDLCILEWADAIGTLDEGDLGAHGVEEVRKFQADRSCSEHDERVGLHLGDDCLFVGLDLVPVDLHPVEPACPGAGSDDDIAAL